jgi:hypothetical protein
MNFKNSFIGLLAGLALSMFSPLAEADWFDHWINGCYIEPGVDTKRGLCTNFLRLGPELGIVYVAQYTYTEDTGIPYWIQGAAVVEAGDYTVDIPLQSTSGGSFGAEIGTPIFDDPNWGTGTFTVNSCSSVTWSVASPNVTDVTLESESVLELVAPVPNSQCVYQEPFTECPDFSTPGIDDRSCVIGGGEYTEDLHLTNNILWILDGAVFVGLKGSADNTNAIHIEPGTRIIGVGQSILGISRGAQIYAEGQPYAPVVFTGVNTASNSEAPGAAGDWGGLTINGRAPINTCETFGACTAQGEGESGPYGGDDPNDSSGVLRYVRVQFAGILFTDENELNGIAFQGVGRGTVVENIQVHANADDGVEFFGGTVNARNLVLTDIEDDSVDWTQGWNGLVQNGLVVQSGNLEIGADRGIEADNLEGNNDAETRAKAWLANFTFIGRPDTTGATFRRGTGVKITNSIFTGFGNCIDLDDSATFANAGTPGALSGNTTIENTILNCGTNFVEEVGDPWTVQAWFEAQPGNMVMNPMLSGAYPPADAAYLHGFPLNFDDFPAYFNNYGHIGAASGDPKEAWFTGWTLQDDFLP